MAFSATPKGITTVRLLKETVATTTLLEDAANGACTLHSVQVTNAGAGVSHWKAFDSLGNGVTIGTTAPIIILRSTASATINWECVGGYPMANGLSWFAAEEAGIAATTAPTTQTDASVTVV